MADGIVEICGVAVLELPEAGAPLARSQDAVDLIAEAHAGQAVWVLLPAARLDAAFWKLRSGLAGEVLQKFAVYGMRLALAGDFTEAVDASEALRDLMRESNRGDAVVCGQPQGVCGTVGAVGGAERLKATGAYQGR